VIWCFWNAEERRWMIPFLLWVLSKSFDPWYQMHHIWLDLYITAGVLCMPNVVMIFWWVVVTIKHHSNLLSVLAKILYIAQVTGSNLLPSMALFPLHYVGKPSTIHYQTWARSVNEVDWVGQDIQTSVGKNCFVGLVHFMVFVTEQGQRQGSHFILLYYQKRVRCWRPLPTYGHGAYPISLIGSCQMCLVFQHYYLEPLQCLRPVSSHPLCQTLIKGKIRCGEW